MKDNAMEIEERFEYLEKEMDRLRSRITELEEKEEETDANQSKTLQASRFTLVDNHGKVRATLGADEYGARLTLHDENGGLRAGLHALKTGSGLTLSDETGKVRIKAGVFNHRPEVVLFDAEGNERILMASTENFGPHLSLFDNKGKDRAVVVVVEQGAGIVISDADGKTIWAAPDSQPRWLSH